MDGWVGFLIAIGVLAVTAPLIAWVGRRHGKSLRGGAGLAFIMLGFGHVIDPPTKHLIEAAEGEEQGSESTGAPKDATGGS
jgi:hypothetical protein